MPRRTDSTTDRNPKATIQLRLPTPMKKLLHCCAIVHETTMQRFITTALRQALHDLPESDPAREVAPELWKALMSDAQNT